MANDPNHCFKLNSARRMRPVPTVTKDVIAVKVQILSTSSSFASFSTTTSTNDCRESFRKFNDLEDVNARNGQECISYLSRLS